MNILEFLMALALGGGVGAVIGVVFILLAKVDASRIARREREEAEKAAQERYSEKIQEITMAMLGFQLAMTNLGNAARKLTTLREEEK